MPNRLLNTIRRAMLRRDGGGLSDGQLLALFVKHRDGDAFAALLKRHGPMVMGLCRRVLLNHHDAEDAFQATFLIFARKAGSVHAHDSIAGWLYRVAYRTALEARARIARRREVNDVPHPLIEPNEGQRELLALLDKEIDRLPEKYRVPIVLCEIEGRSNKEVAHLLGVPEGTLSWRLAHAKKMLAKRLSRRGVSLTVGALTGLTGALSPALRASTIKTVLSAGTVPAQVLTLTEGVMKAMLLSKLKITVCFAALALAAGVGASGLTYRATAQQPRQETAQVSRPQADELEALRLEFEALRKSLQATRQRVKALEEEVQTLRKGNRSGNWNPAGTNPGGGPPRTRPGQPTAESASSTAPLPHPTGFPGSNGTAATTALPAAGPTAAASGGAAYPLTTPPSDSNAANPLLKPQSTKSDPLAHAEKALKQLRVDPNDMKAVEALERALQRLKEREKPKAPVKQTPLSK